LDVDVYEVGHHGSHNATTDELLSAMTPEIAIISCGRWTDGRSEAGNPFTTWKYGHPRAETVDRLLSVLTRRRSEPLSVRVFDAPRESRRVTIRKALYATGWEGNISVRATSTGRFLVRTNL
jgi:competence protein ComEC